MPRPSRLMRQILQPKPGPLATAWSGCMIVLVLYFAASCIEQLAQRRAAQLELEADARDGKRN